MYSLYTVEKPRLITIHSKLSLSYTYQNLGSCCSSYNHPPKFWPAPILEPHLESFTWWLHTLRFTPWAHVSLYIHLSCLLHPSLCMLMYKSCLRPCSGYAQSLCFICVWCVHHESIYHTHTWSHIHCRASILPIMNDQSRVLRLSLAPSVSHV